MIKAPITYKLDIDGSAARTYYPAIAEFTDTVLYEAERAITPLARSYRSFLQEYRLEQPRSTEEYAFELLNLGVLWRRYGTVSLAVNVAPFRLLAFLSEWRKKHQRVKPAVDVVRGILMSFFLVPFEPILTAVPPRTLNELGQLVRWLEATGDFREDALRFVRWLAFFSSLDKPQFDEAMQTIMEFSDWFDKTSTSCMGKFTPNVTTFVEQNAVAYRWREDRFASLRSRVEYHLNMVGAEIMNRAFRSEFARTERTTVLLPGCMRSRISRKCEGMTTSEGIRCTGCEPRCRVNQLRERGVRQKFDVVVIPHSSDLSRWAPADGKPLTGVIASACLSVLVQGGWELKRYGVPAQCVLLNECGCKKHWHREGITTQLDVRQLKQLCSAGAAQPAYPESQATN